MCIVKSKLEEYFSLMNREWMNWKFENELRFEYCQNTGIASRNLMRIVAT